MKIFVKISDDPDYGATVTMIAANSIDEAKFIMTGAQSMDEYVERSVEGMHPKNHRDRYKTEAGWKQAISQYESFNKNRVEKDAKDVYGYLTSEMHDTGIETQISEPKVLWQNERFV